MNAKRRQRVIHLWWFRGQSQKDCYTDKLLTFPPDHGDGGLRKPLHTLLLIVAPKVAAAIASEAVWYDQTRGPALDKYMVCMV